MSEMETTFEQWAVLELMGHGRIAGLVREVNVAGAGFLRVDVPDGKGEVRFSKFYSPSAVYAINPVEKEIAVAVASHLDAAPVTRYELRQLLPPESPREPVSFMDDEEDEDEGLYLLDDDEDSE